MLTMSSGIMVPLPDKSAQDSMEGTYVWDYSQESCPNTLVQLYLGPTKVLTNASVSLVGELVILDGPKKDQVAGLELTETHVLWGQHAAKTHIRKIVVFIHHPRG